MARLYGESPDNTVAWRKLCEAAVSYAKSIGLSRDSIEMYLEFHRAMQSELLRRKLEILRGKKK